MILSGPAIVAMLLQDLVAPPSSIELAASSRLPLVDALVGLIAFASIGAVAASGGTIRGFFSQAADGAFRAREAFGSRRWPIM